MARDIVNEDLINNKEMLAKYLQSGEKPQSNFRVGTENESFAFFIDDNKPVPYEGTRSISAILTQLEQKLGWLPIIDDNKIIGLASDEGAAISIEPGGQLELSGAPLFTINDTSKELQYYINMLSEIVKPMKIGFLNMGAHPAAATANIPKMPKSRYKIMDKYMAKVGSTGHDMMYGTATVQANLDFSSESDMRRKMQLGMKLQPIATALFASSPFSKAVPNGYCSWRAAIWRDTDNQRTGLLPFVWSNNFGYSDYVEWALDVNMYFIVREGIYIDCTHMSFNEFLEHGYNGYKATMGDFINHLSTLFPEVRLKTYIEMRGADCGLPSMLCALPALWVGLLYSEKAIADLCDLTGDWSVEEVQKMLFSVSKEGLKTKFRQHSLQEIAIKIVDIAIAGLEDRGKDEARFLEPIKHIAYSGKSIAEIMLEGYRGNVAQLFNEYAMIR